MDLFGAKAKAMECRLLAVNSCGLSRDKYLALADDYDAIDDAMSEALLRYRLKTAGLLEADALKRPVRLHS